MQRDREREDRLENYFEYRPVKLRFINNRKKMLAIPETFALKTFAWKLRLWKFDQSFWPVGQIISWLFIRNAVIVYGYGCFLSSSIERNAFLWAQVRTHRAFTRIRAIISRLNELSTPHRENLCNEMLYISTHLFGINLSESIKCTSCKNKRKRYIEFSFPE